jgi:hypothetical protein
MPDKPDAIHHRAWRLVVRLINSTSHAVALVFCFPVYFRLSTFYSLAAKPRAVSSPSAAARGSRLIGFKIPLGDCLG